MTELWTRHSVYFRGEKNIETDFVSLIKGKENSYLPENDNVLVTREGNTCLNISFKIVLRLSENFRF